MTRKKAVITVLALLLCLTQLSACKWIPKGNVRQTLETAVTDSDADSTETASETNPTAENDPETDTARESESNQEKKSITERESKSETADNAASTNDDGQLATLRQRILACGVHIGIAYIGPVDSDATEEELRQYVADSAYAAPYSFLGEAPLVDAKGAELYAIVTTEDCALSVFPTVLTDDGLLTPMDPALRQSDGNDCFLLRCNVSDIVPNVECAVTIGDEYYTLSPQLSGMDGALACPGICDFSIYQASEQSATDTRTERTEKDIEIASRLLSESAEVSERIEASMVLLYIGEEVTIDDRECMLFALGTDNDGQFVREYLYGVCDNLIYAYDALTDMWSQLAMG